MKGLSQSFEAAGAQPPAGNVEGFSGPFDRRLLAIGLWVFAGYYFGAKIGFALTFKPHVVSVLWPPNSILFASFLLTPPRIWCFAPPITFLLRAFCPPPPITGCSSWWPPFLRIARQNYRVTFRP